jgi:hypothetical protein
MPTIKGPIKFEKGKDPPLKIKNWIKENRIKTPFDPATSIFTNKPDWAKIK